MLLMIFFEVTDLIKILHHLCISLSTSPEIGVWFCVNTTDFTRINSKGVLTTRNNDLIRWFGWLDLEAITEVKVAVRHNESIFV